jgi:hypothetical protein
MSGILSGSGGTDDTGSENGSQMKDKLKKVLALIANTASSGKVPQLDISEPQAKEWKPTTKQEALEFALAKMKPDKKDDVKDFEQGIKLKVANGEGLSQNEAAYANRFMRRAGDIEDFKSEDSSEGQTQAGSQSDGASGDKLGILGRIISAIRSKLPGAGTDQQQTAAGMLPGVEAMQSVAQSLPSVTMAQRLSKLIGSGQGDQSQSGAQKSPYSEYPDAFQENGIWKVVRDGKKYRIEE